MTAMLGNRDCVKILEVLLHEQLHAFDGCINGHEAPFQKLCKLVGLEGGRTKKAKCSFTATVAGAELTANLKALSRLSARYRMKLYR